MSTAELCTQINLAPAIQSKQRVHSYRNQHHTNEMFPSSRWTIESNGQNSRLGNLVCCDPLETNGP